MNPAHKAVLDEILLAIPSVTTGTPFGYPAYYIGKKIFCWASDAGVALKLPAARIAEILATDPHARRYYPAPGIVWRAWVQIQRHDPEEYHDLRGLFHEALQHVAG
jgi:hypothetical protein